MGKGKKKTTRGYGGRRAPKRAVSLAVILSVATLLVAVLALGVEILMPWLSERQDRIEAQQQRDAAENRLGAAEKEIVELAESQKALRKQLAESLARDPLWRRYGQDLDFYQGFTLEDLPTQISIGVCGPGPCIAVRITPDQRDRMGVSLLGPVFGPVIDRSLRTGPGAILVGLPIAEKCKVTFTSAVVDVTVAIEDDTAAAPRIGVGARSGTSNRMSYKIACY